MASLRVDLSSRHRQVATRGQVRVGKAKTRTFNDEVIVQDEVEIDRAGGVPILRPDPPEIGFDAPQAGAKILRGDLSLKKHGGVEEVGLSWWAGRWRRVDTRGRNDPTELR